jgi:GTP-binding protein
VAIVGRPNVGKSSVFNALLRRRVSIVEPTPGVTRDRIYAETTFEGRPFTLADTGGIGITDRPDLASAVEDQVRAAVAEADFVVFLVDIREGPAPLDVRAAEILRRSGKPLLLAANKADTPNLDAQAAEFFRLGLGEALPVSAEHRRNIGEILECAAAAIPVRDEAPPALSAMRLAVVGRRNSGKSTLVNVLAGAPRVIVSEIPGTTRDSVDVSITREGKTFILVDTAGIRRRSAIQNSIEFYSQARAERSVRFCDVALLLLDAAVDVGTIEKKIGDQVVSHYKGCVIGVNKWDLVPDRIATDAYETYIRDRLHGLFFAPISFLSAKEGWNVEETLALAEEIYRQRRLRVSTADVNRVLRAAVERQSPPVGRGKKPKIFYASQVGVDPPTVVLFANDPDLLGKDYLRYLSNEFREALPFGEVPVRFVLRKRKRGEEAKEPE